MTNRHTGSTFDSFLDEEGIRDEVEAVAVKRVLAWQFQKAMQEQKKTKKAMAKDLHTSRSQVDRLLDPNKLSVTLDTINKAAKVLHKGVRIQIVDLYGPDSGLYSLDSTGSVQSGSTTKRRARVQKPAKHLKTMTASA